jgi:hypothetical protein
MATGWERHTSLWAATTLELRKTLGWRCRIVTSIISAFGAHATAVAERDVVRAGDSLVAPRHVCGGVAGCEEWEMQGEEMWNWLRAIENGRRASRVRLPRPRIWQVTCARV